MPNQHKKWTKEEEQIIVKNYHKTSLKGLMGLLPNRSYKAIEIKVQRLGVKSKRKQPNEIKILKNHAIIYIDSQKYGLKEVLIDLEDLEKIKKYKWYVRLGDTRKKILYILSSKEKIYLHRLIINAPINMQVDHINHDTFDNRKCNLRICTNIENNQNKSFNNVYKFTNNWGKDYWCARISCKGKIVFNRYYPFTEEGKLKALNNVIEYKKYNLPFTPEATLLK